MKRYFTLLILCFLQPSLAMAQPCAFQPRDASGAWLPLPPALLWKVEKPGQPASYVMGTYHDPAPQVIAKFNRLKPFWDELHFVLLESKMNDPQVNAEVEKFMFLPLHQRLSNLMGFGEFHRMMQASKDYPDLTAEVMDGLTPWAASMVFAYSPEVNNAPVLDSYIGLRAEQSGKIVGGLETTAEGLGYFIAMPMDEQLSYLKETVDFLPLSAIDSQLLEHFYLEENLQGLHNYYRESMLYEVDFEKDDFETDLLISRNQHFAHRADFYMRRGASLVAIGSLHLPGESGLLALLDKKGYCLIPQVYYAGASRALLGY